MASKGRQFKDLMNAPEILIQPGIYDGYTARLVERSGFKAASISGAGVSESRMGWVDRGVMTFDENLANARRLADCTDRLLMRADADTGYGNAMTVHFVVRAFEKAGMAALMFEDQVWPKRCGHMAGKQLMPPERMEANLRAVSGERMRPDTFIIARTDARELHGLDEALRRGERYLRAGADGLFIEAPASLEELARIGGAFAGVPQLANMLEGGRTPLLPPSELGQLGFSMAIYGISLLMHATHAMQGVLAELARGEVGFAGRGVGFEEYKDIVGVERWSRIEATYG